MILGLSGKAASGKDTLADHLLEEYNWSKKIAFASNLKEACKVIFNLSDHQVLSQEGKKTEFKTTLVVNEVHIKAVVNWMRKTHDVKLESVNFYKYLGAELKTPRDVLQYVGTEVMRAYSDNYHMEVVTDELRRYEDVAVTDVRFPNEAQGILDAGGSLVRVERSKDLRMLSGASFNSEHASEVALDNWGSWDYVVDNNYSFSELYKQIKNMLEELRK